MKGLVGLSDVSPNSTVTELGLLLSHTPCKDADLTKFLANLNNMISLKKLKIYIGNFLSIFVIINRRLRMWRRNTL